MLLVHVTRLCMGGIRTQFGRHIRGVLVAKNSLLPYHWKRHYMFFLMVRRVSATVEWFVTRKPFLFSFLVVFLLPKKLYIDHLYCWYFNLSFYSFNFKFLFLIFYKSFICFQFRSLISIWHIIFFKLVLIFLISNFFLDYFIKNLLIFNFILYSKIYIYTRVCLHCKIHGNSTSLNWLFMTPFFLFYRQELLWYS
jgi:hypothetical protein